MSRNPITTTALAAALLGTLALAGCRKEEPTVPPPTATPAPSTAPAASTPAPVAGPAVRVTSVDLGTAVDAGNRVASPTTTFATGDTIHASVATTSTGSAPQTGQLTARWTFEDGQVVDETSRDFNFTGDGVTTFQISKPDGWPAGDYRLEILQDGEVVQTRDFEVR